MFELTPERAVAFGKRRPMGKGKEPTSSPRGVRAQRKTSADDERRLDERVPWSGKFSRRVLQKIQMVVMEERAAPGVTKTKGINQAAIIERLLRDQLGLPALKTEK